MEHEFSLLLFAISLRYFIKYTIFNLKKQFFCIKIQ